METPHFRLLEAQIQTQALERNRRPFADACERVQRSSNEARRVEVRRSLPFPPRQHKANEKLPAELHTNNEEVCKSLGERDVDAVQTDPLA